MQNTENTAIMENSKPPPFHVILDETGFYFGNNDDSLKGVLRNIEGIPNATYLVKDGGVFVFEKLLSLVKNHWSYKVESTRQPEDKTKWADLALELLPLATCSADEAVLQWGIIPLHYKLVPCGLEPDTPYVIQHEPFMANLPRQFKDELSAKKQLAILLTGGVCSGAGEFSYAGQGMKLAIRIGSIDDLPPRPTIDISGLVRTRPYSPLESLDYQEGFAPISRALFDVVKTRIASWNTDSETARQSVYQESAVLWSVLHELPLATLNNDNYCVPDYDGDESQELRNVYPELSMLSDDTLYSLYDNYQMDCCYTNGWSAMRDEAFLRFLLGRLAGFSDSYEAEDAGKMVAFALLRGDTFQSAVDFAIACADYHTAIITLTNRVAKAMRFIKEDKESVDRRGHKIGVMTDIFQQARNYNIAFTPISTEQMSPADTTSDD